MPSASAPFVKPCDRQWRSRCIPHQESPVLSKSLTNLLPNPQFNNPGLWKPDCRIAVTGFTRSGKTVFLTSLISHLLHHEPERFHLGPNLHIVKPESLPPTKGWSQFPYMENRRFLAGNHAGKPEWPEKTRFPSQYRLEFERSDWRLSRMRLTLYDLPGERFADCAMYRQGFQRWSLQQIQWLTGLNQQPPELDGFLSLVASDAPPLPTADQLIFSYKKALAALYRGYHQFITPSTFVLSAAGENPHVADLFAGAIAAGDFETIATGRCSGLPEAEFTPLPQHLFGQPGELVGQFEARFQRYQREIVEPLFRTLARCDAMAVLLDLAHILQGGEGVCDDAETFVKQILNAVQPGRRYDQIGRGWLPNRDLRGQSITRVAFAASQIDRFHDQDHARVRHLLSELVRPVFHAYRGAKTKVFSCSAVCSAVSDEAADILYPKLMEEMLGETYRGNAIRVARVPDWKQWPSSWDPKELFLDRGGFPRLPAQMPQRRNAVPDHLCLDDVFRFLLDWCER